MRIIALINLAGAVHALAQAVLLVFTDRGNRRANRIMAAFLLALAVGMSHGFMSLLGVYRRWPALALLMGPLVLIYGPLFYFYVKDITTKDSHRRFADLMHGLPFLLGSALYASPMLFHDAVAKLPGILAFILRSAWLPVVAMAAAQTMAYIILIKRRLRDYSRKIKTAYSTIDRINLDWLKWRLLAYLLIWTAGLAIMALAGFSPGAINVAGQIMFLISALNIFATGYRGLLHPQVFFGPLEEQPAPRYEHSTLTPEKAAHALERLFEFMEHEKPFLDAEITMPKMARHLDLPAGHFSQVINERLGKNFYEFINYYRVEHAKRLLAGPAAGRDKLAAIAFQSGFTSLATFNRVFKELTGLTPSAYRQNASPRPS